MSLQSAGVTVYRGVIYRLMQATTRDTTNCTPLCAFYGTGYRGTGHCVHPDYRNHVCPAEALTRNKGSAAYMRTEPEEQDI